MRTAFSPEPQLPGAWADRGACRGYPTEWWYPGGALMSHRPAWLQKEDMAVAKRICLELCPVRAECLVHAIKYREIGIWAGTSDAERRDVRRRLRGAA